MGNLLLGVTLILFGVNQLTAFLPAVVIGILFIVTGVLLVLEGRGVIHRA